MDPHSFIARAEAQRWLGIAEKLLMSHDLVGSKTFAIRARDSDPRLEAADQILAIADTLLAAEKRVVGNNGAQQPDYYAILQLVRFVQETDHIADQYRRLAVVLNPNQNRFPYSDQAFQLVNEAWTVLSNPMRKSMYDSELDFAPQQQQQMNLGFNLEQQHHQQPQQQQQQHHQQQQHNFFSINQEIPESTQSFQNRLQQTQQHQQLQQHNFLSQPNPSVREQDHLFQHREQEQLFQPQVQPFQVTSPPHQQTRPSPQPRTPIHSPPPATSQPPFSWQQEHMQQQQQQQLQQKQIKQEQQQHIKQEQLKQQQLRDEQMKQQKMQQEKLKQQQHIQQEQVKQQRMQEEQLKQQRLHEEQLKQQRLHEEQLKQQRMHEEQLKQQRMHEEQLKQQRIQEEQLKQQRIQEEQLKQQRMQEEQLKLQQQQEQLKQQQLQQEQLKQQQLQQEQLKQQQMLLEQQMQQHIQQEQQKQQESFQQNAAPVQQVNSHNGVWEEETEAEAETEAVDEIDDDSPTFWTSCPYCFYMYEYPKLYADCTLRCDNCKRAFQAVRISSPPPIVEGQDAYFCCWGFIPVGVSMSHLEKDNNKGTKSNWTPFSPLFDASKNGHSHLNECAAPKKNTFVNKSSGPRIYFDDITDDSSDIEWDRPKKNNLKRMKKVLDPGFKKRIKVLALMAVNVRNGGVKNLKHGISVQAGMGETGEEISKKVVVNNPTRQSGWVAKESGKLDLNVEFNNNEGEEPARRMSTGNPGHGHGEEDNIEGIGFFEGLDDFFSGLPILSVVNEEKVMVA